MQLNKLVPTIFRRFLSTGQIHLIRFPPYGDSVTDGDMEKFYVKKGEHVEVDQPLTSIETHKGVFEVKAPTDGHITEFLVQPPTKVNVGQPLCNFLTAPKPITPTNNLQTQNNVETMSNLKPILNNLKQSIPQITNVPPPSSPIIHKDQKDRKEYVEPLSRLRKVVSQRLKEAQNTCALLTTFQEVNMEECIRLREQNQDDFLKQHGVKLGFMPFLFKHVPWH